MLVFFNYYICQPFNHNMNFNNYNFKNKKALIRVDFNVPLDKSTGEVADDTRIRLALPTINKILKDGGSVVLMSHMGRPKDKPENEFSLKQILPCLSALLNKEIKFADDCISEESYNLSKNLSSGKVLLLENLRFYKEEKEGDENFASKLAKHGDVYINDAFGTAHRAHASTATVSKFFPENKMFGLLIENEINSVNQVLNSNDKPLTAIVGGAKVSSKITIISRLLDKVDHLIIGGGMAYTFIKALGGSIGNSLVEDDFISTAKEIIDKAKHNGVQLHLPIDTVIASKFSNDCPTELCDISQIKDGYMGLDIGPKSIALFKDVVLSSSLILWNGPMGVFEMSNFQKGTVDVAYAVVEATENGSFSLVGGGDSVAAVNQFNLANKVSHVSTGGGAMLEYLEGKELPGIKSILN